MVLSSECSAAICYDRRKWNNVLKVLKKENVNTSQGFLCSARLTFEHKEHKLLLTWHGRVETPLFPRALLQEAAEEHVSDKQVRCPRHRHQASAQHWTPLVTRGTNARRGLGGLCSTLLGAGWSEDGDEAWHWNVGDRVLCGSHFKCFYNRNLLVGMLALFCCSELLYVYCEMKWGNVTTMLSFLCPWEPRFSVHRSQHRVGHKRQCHGAAF